MRKYFDENDEDDEDIITIINNSVAKDSFKCFKHISNKQNCAHIDLNTLPPKYADHLRSIGML